MGWIKSLRPKPGGSTPELPPGFLSSQAAGFLPVAGATVDTEYAELPEIMAPGTNDFLASYRYGISTEGVMEVGYPSIAIPMMDDEGRAWGQGPIPGPASLLGE
jgi:hypothetical protein